eukprot:755378-Hanusia_phi.AAC.4
MQQRSCLCVSTASRMIGMSSSKLGRNFSNTPTPRQQRLAHPNSFVSGFFSQRQPFFVPGFMGNKVLLFRMMSGGTEDGKQERDNQRLSAWKRRISQKGPINWQSVGLLVLVGGAFVIYYNEQERKRLLRLQETKIGQGFGKADIGGPFVLLDQNGKTRSHMDFRGKYMFMYFGFTFLRCSVCRGCTRISAVLMYSVATDKMHVADKIAPIFVTIDPERDGPLQLKEYLSDWDSRIVGTPDQIKDICQKYRVYHSKSTLGSNPGDYLIDHSILFYILDPEGNFVDYFGKSLSVEDIAMKVFKYVTGTADASTHRQPLPFSQPHRSVKVLFQPQLCRLQEHRPPVATSQGGVNLPKSNYGQIVIPIDTKGRPQLIKYILYSNMAHILHPHTLKLSPHPHEPWYSISSRCLPQGRLPSRWGFGRQTRPGLCPPDVAQLRLNRTSSNM